MRGLSSIVKQSGPCIVGQNMAVSCRLREHRSVLVDPLHESGDGGADFFRHLVVRAAHAWNVWDGRVARKNGRKGEGRDGGEIETKQVKPRTKFDSTRFLSIPCEVSDKNEEG